MNNKTAKLLRASHKKLYQGNHLKRDFRKFKKSYLSLSSLERSELKKELVLV